MSRPTVYGKEVVVNNQNKCIGINLGYNFYCEHECGTSGIVEACNRVNPMQLSFLSSISPIKYRKEIAKLKRQIKLEEKLISRWNNTPFKGYVLSPSTYSLLKMVIIDNSVVKQKYRNVFLNDGHYYLLSVGDGLTQEVWEKKFGTKKTVSEEDLFYMPDYQGLCRNTGYILNNGGRLVQKANFGASWASSCRYFYILLPAEQKSYLGDLQNALKAGNLACVPQEERLFKDRGCCLIDLETAYKSQ